MKKLNIIFASTLMLAVAACGDKEESASDSSSANSQANTYDALTKETRDVEIKNKPGLTKGARFANTYINEMDKMASALENVDDAKSAEKAATVIHDMNAKLESMSGEFDDGVAMEQRVVMAMASRQQEIIAVQQRITSQMMRLQAEDPELLKIVTDEMGQRPSQ